MSIRSLRMLASLWGTVSVADWRNQLCEQLDIAPRDVLKWLANTIKESEQVRVYFIEDFAFDRYRVWRTDCPGDQFDLVPRNEVEAAKPWLKNFPWVIFGEPETD
jgi:hypothetical protein